LRCARGHSYGSFRFIIESGVANFVPFSRRVAIVWINGALRQAPIAAALRRPLKVLHN
jgi:hypothetical protein